MMYWTAQVATTSPRVPQLLKEGLGHKTSMIHRTKNMANSLPHNNTPPGVAPELMTQVFCDYPPHKLHALALAA